MIFQRLIFGLMCLYLTACATAKDPALANYDTPSVTPSNDFMYRSPQSANALNREGLRVRR